MRGLAFLLGGIIEERPNRRQFARRRRCPEPAGAAISEEGAQVGWLQRQQCKAADLLAAMAAEEIDKAMRRRDIGAHGVRRAAAIVLQIAAPAGRQVARRMADI